MEPYRFIFKVTEHEVITLWNVDIMLTSNVMYHAFMETAWRFPGRRHNLGTSLGGAVVDQCHLGTQQPQLRT